MGVAGLEVEPGDQGYADFATVPGGGNPSQHLGRRFRIFGDKDTDTAIVGAVHLGEIGAGEAVDGDWCFQDRGLNAR